MKSVAVPTIVGLTGWVGWLVLLVPCASAADWITAPSYYTHSPYTGERVTQYAPHEPAYVPPSLNYLRSGYRHTRSTIRAGQSFDQMHVVEEWGRPVRPYGEWQFPYRPYSVPYDLWGPPLIFTPPPYPYPWFPGHPGNPPPGPPHAGYGGP